MDKIKTIVRKEWAEVFKNKMVLFTVAFMPLIFTVLPLVILYTMRGESGMNEVAGDLPEQFSSMCPADLPAGECFQVYMVSQFMIMFMLIPATIPAAIASYSIVGEKTTRTLEPLLATPITTIELLAGKSLAAAIPGIGATFVSFGLYAIGAWFIVTNKATFFAMMDLRWLLAVFVLGPLMAFLAVFVSVMVSSRVNDPRVAEQLSMVVILPVMLFFFGQIAGLFFISSPLVLVAALVLLILNVLMAYLSVRLFQRETILTRWK